MDVKKSSLEQQHEEEKEEFRDCLDGDQVVGQLQEQLNAASFVEQENKTHPSLQLASTALSKGITLDAFNNVVPPTPTSSGPSTPERRVSSSSSIDPEKAGANLIQINPVDLKTIGENTLTPAEQEKEDEAVLRGLRHLFNNRFMSAKTLFEQRADRDPLYALALSSMAFLKAVMTSGEHDHTMALNVLNTTYSLAKAQLDATKKTSRISGYFSGYYNYFKRDSGSSPTSTASPSSDISTPNGILRAHVVKAECCLLIAVLQLLQESVMSYVKCGLNLRRAYASYNFVWQKYKAMGDDACKYMDRDTISGVQFGIGSVHFVLSALPAKIWKAISVLGWKPDKELGFKLLKECADNKRIRSSMATVMLLAYYATAASFTPQILSEQYTKIAMETLLEAQRYYPNSALYLFFAGRISRLALDLSLSTQSYLYAAEMTKNDWAETAVANACRYEIAVNHMITGNWNEAASSFEQLHKEKYWSPAFCKYMQGSCLEMAGNRSAAILAYAEVPRLVVKKLGGRMSDIDAYALRKVQLFQSSGYQELDLHVPILEFMCIWNLFHFMDKPRLDYCLRSVNKALETIQIQEQEEYDKRSQELAPETSPPDHFDKRATLLLVKAALQNVKGNDPAENTIILNWIIDHKDNLATESWVVPYALWEAGVACWNVNNRNRSRHVWEMALEFSSYDFEYRLAVRLNLAMTHAEELGYTKPIPQPTDDKKRFSVSLPAMAAAATAASTNNNNRSNSNNTFTISSSVAST